MSSSRRARQIQKSQRREVQQSQFECESPFGKFVFNINVELFAGGYGCASPGAATAGREGHLHTLATTSGGGEPWSNPERMKGPKGQNAAIALIDEDSQSLAVYASKFGFQVPNPTGGPALAGTHPIDGVQVKIWSSATSSLSINTHELYLGKANGAYGSNNRGYGSGEERLWTILPSYNTDSGGPNDGASYWGFASLTKDDVISDNFGVKFRCENFGSSDDIGALVDVIQMKIWYTVGGTQFSEPLNAADYRDTDDIDPAT